MLHSRQSLLRSRMSVKEARACLALQFSSISKTTCHHEVGEVAHNANDKAGQELGDCVGHDEPRQPNPDLDRRGLLVNGLERHVVDDVIVSDVVLCQVFVSWVIHLPLPQFRIFVGCSLNFTSYRLIGKVLKRMLTLRMKSMVQGCTS